MNQDRMKKRSEQSRTDMEPAEGSRENVRGSGSSSERGLGGDSGMRSGTTKRSGISNRDRDREDFEQDQLPDRDSESDR